MADKEISVSVPEERIGSFYEWFGRWLNADTDVAFVPLNQLEVRPIIEWDVDSDAALGRAILRDVGPAGRELVSALTDRGEGVPVSWRILASRCGLDGRQGVAQLIGMIALSCWRNDRALPVAWFDAGDGASYWLDPGLRRFWAHVLRSEPSPGRADDGGVPTAIAAPNNTTARPSP